MSNEITKKYEPEWENWRTSGVAKFGHERTLEFIGMVADACELLKAESRDETDFLIFGVRMLMKNISEVAEKARSSIGQS